MDNLSPQDFVQLVSTLGASGALAYFIRMLAGKKLAWWYQVEERDQRIAELETEKRDLKQEYEARCLKWERLYFESKQLTHEAVSATHTAVSKLAETKGR